MEPSSQTASINSGSELVKERFLKNEAKKSGENETKKSGNDKSDAWKMFNAQKQDDSTNENNDDKCRYCFGGPFGWVVKQQLIKPCWCSGSLAYVHRSCLEKWLTIRNQSTCDLCKYEFVTEKKYKHIKEIKFERMEAEDICVLVTTILVYITFIFQFLAAAYIGILADSIPTPVFSVSMTGLSLGIIWFSVGCIALTVFTYTSDYWENWRETNQRLSLVMKYIKTNKDADEDNVDDLAFLNA